MLKQEQLADDTLVGPWRMAKQGKGNYFIKAGLLYRLEKRFGQAIEAVCIPKARRPEVIKMAHNTAHWAAKKTKERIIISGMTWPTVVSDVKQYARTCQPCQLRARVTCYDRVSISAIPRDPEVFRHWFMDCAGPLLPGQSIQYNYALILVDSASRYPVCYPLRSLSAKNVCDALLNLFMTTGIASGMIISSDNGSNFRSALTREFMSRLNISPVFSTPGHPQACALAERAIGTIKGLVSKVAYEHKRVWHKYIGFVLWAMRESANETTKCPPFLLVFNRLPTGPLSILKETLTGERDLPVNLGKTAVEYLEDIRDKMEVAQRYANEQSQVAQQRYVDRYNLRAGKSKDFSVGDKCLLLYPDSTSSKVFSRWTGPANIEAVLSPNSYLVEFDGKRYRMHANNLRKFHVRVDEVVCQSIMCPMPDMCDDISADCNCAIIYESDVDFGEIAAIDPPTVNISELLPSQKIKPEVLSHLSSSQKQELLQVLDRFPEVFSDTPGLCTAVQHEIPIASDFRPKRLKAYRVPELYKPEVNRQIAELLRLGFIEPSTSPMASPIVCVLKGKDIKNGLRIAIDYRYVNRYTLPNVTPLSDISEIIQKVGRCRYISVFDAKSGYHQCPVRPDQRWLTAFVCDAGLFQWTRTPFGMRSSGCTFVTALKQILQPIREFTQSYVDDMAVHSDNWRDHLSHVERFLSVIKESGFTLGLNKCQFGKNEIKFVGHIIGSGKRRADPS